MLHNYEDDDMTRVFLGCVLIFTRGFRYHFILFLLQYLLFFSLLSLECRENAKCVNCLSTFFM